MTFAGLCASIKSYKFPLRLIPVCLLVLLIITHNSGAAYAADPVLDMDTCAPGFTEHDLTPKIVRCIEDSVIDAVLNMLSALKAFLTPMAGALITLSFAIAGIRMVSGEKPGRSAMFLIRITLITYFWFNLEYYGMALFDISQELITIVSGGYSPWYQIDNFLGNLLGFGPTLLLFQGVLGIIAGSLTGDSGIGFMVFAAGTHAVIALLMFIMNVVYTYLMSVIMLGFLIVISPIFLPWAVFFITERYLRKVIDLIISVILMPALLFAFVHLFMMIFENMINGIIDVLPLGRDFRGIWRINNPVFGWVMPSDTSLTNRLQSVRMEDFNNPPPINTPAVGTTVNPFLRHAFSNGSFQLPSIDFGPTDPQWKKVLAYKFIALFLFAQLMKTMVTRIPEITGGIAGAVVGIPISATSPAEMVKNVRGNIEMGLGATAGGALGGELGGAAAGAAGGNQHDQRLARQGGGILGAVSGMMVTRRR
jgi:hypothetical protein